jgi:hypothetical protein
VEPQPLEIFTLEEAEALLSTMTSVMTEIGQLRDQLREQSEKLQILQVLWADKVLEAHNPDHGEYRRLRRAAEKCVDRVESLIRDEIVARGVRFPPGGVEHGLLDFPTTLDGRVVFFCWRLGEPHIAHWHEIDGGFAGRQPVTPELARRMGVGDA